LNNVEIGKIVIATFLVGVLFILLVSLLPFAVYSQIPFLPDTEDKSHKHSAVVHGNNSTKASVSKPVTTNNLTTKLPPSITQAKNVILPAKVAPLAIKDTSLPGNKNGVDKFGIKEIYPTKAGSGREWYIKMNDPRNDPIFSIGSDQGLIKQNSSSSSSSGSSNDHGGGDGSWRITNPQVRMHVSTPANSTQWKNVEITGYVKVNSTNNYNSQHHQKDIPNDIAWLARGGLHTDNAPCDGTALIGGIHDDGTVGWKKEIWFTGGYTNESAQAKPTNSIIGRWIGWKVVMYNVNNNTAVKMESYLDDKNSNHWTRITSLADYGGWYADTSDKKFYSIDCGKPKDYVMTNSGPDVIFRSDNMILDFKNLSVREIQPPIP
jgi:hypothetical protein